MLYLYYWDGKLKNAPPKFDSESEIVQKLNKWTAKIDATNGYTNCTDRLLHYCTKAYQNKDKDYHILTNSHSLLKDMTYLCNYVSTQKPLDEELIEYYYNIMRIFVKPYGYNSWRSYEDYINLDKESPL